MGSTGVTVQQAERRATGPAEQSTGLRLYPVLMRAAQLAKALRPINKES